MAIHSRKALYFWILSLIFLSTVNFFITSFMSGQMTLTLESILFEGILILILVSPTIIFNLYIGSKYKSFLSTLVVIANAILICAFYVFTISSNPGAYLRVGGDVLFADGQITKIGLTYQILRGFLFSFIAGETTRH